VPKYRVEITKVAESDIKDIFRHIASDNPAAANLWVNEIGRQIDSLEKFPSRCPVIPESQDLGKEYLHFLYGNYRTIFRMEGSRVIIMRVIHRARLLDLTVIQK
jgi:toxin ParE1/3/4